MQKSSVVMKTAFSLLTAKFAGNISRFSLLNSSEYQYILEEYNVRKKHDFKKWTNDTEKDREYAFNSLPIIYRGEENYICPSSKFWEQRYYSALFNEHAEPDFKQKLCVNYLQTLQWCLNITVANVVIGVLRMNITTSVIADGSIYS